MLQHRAATDSKDRDVAAKALLDKTVADEQAAAAINGVAESRENEYDPNDDDADPTSSGSSGRTADVFLRGDTGGLRSGGKPVVRGLGIAAEFQRSGAKAVIGQVVTNPSELGELAQIYRDPRYVCRAVTKQATGASAMC